MDHLPCPLEPFKPLKVPYFNGPPYTPPFETFLGRQDDELRGGVAESLQTDPAGFLGLVQSWIFFGLVHDFLESASITPKGGESGILDDFLADEHGRCLEEPEALHAGWQDAEVLRYTDSERTQAPRVFWDGVVTSTNDRKFITTKRLWWYLHRAICVLKEKPAQEVEQAMVRLEKRMGEAYGVIHTMEHHLPTTVTGTYGTSESQALFEDHCLALGLSVHALRQALTQAKLALEGRQGMEGVHGSTLLARRMARLGWCPSQADWVAKSFSPVSGYYISLLGPGPRPLQYHHDCTGRGCSLLQIDEATYQTQHVEGCDKGCNFVAPSVDDMCDILEDGGIPVLTIRLCGEGGLEVRVKRCGPDCEFYAISHVWSDGMGNPHANALPECQLSMLASTAIAARNTKQTLSTEKHYDDDEVAIWVDTICVPLPHKFRKLAIQRMKETYALATRVLVFDATLRQCTLRGASALERGYRVLSCNWQRRLWTLQEAVFAPKLAFKFSDGILFFEDLPIPEEEDQEDGKVMPPADFAALEMRMALGYFCSGMYRAEITTGVINQTARVDRLIETITHFCHRTTSRMSDEAICLATLLDADVGAVLDAPEKERFRHVLGHQLGFSPAIIFLHGPKMAEEPYRWAPTSFMYPWNYIQRQLFTPMPLMGRGPGGSTTIRVATVTSNGLLLDLPGILICAPDKGFVEGTHFFVVDRTAQGAELLSVTTIPEDGSDSGGTKPTLRFERDGNTEAGNVVEPGREAEATHAILLVGFIGKTMVGYKQQAPSHVVGLVISGVEQTWMEINGQATEVLTGRCETRVSVVEVKGRRDILERYGKKIYDDEGNLKGVDIQDSCLRGQVVQDRLLKMCIR